MKFSTFVIFLLVIMMLGIAFYLFITKRHKGDSCCSPGENIKKVPPSDKDKKNYIYTTYLEIGGMVCEDCARKVENSLNSLEGVMSKVNFSTKKAIVMTKEPPNISSFKGAVKSAGFVVLNVEAQ